LEQQWGTNQFADGGLTLQISKGFTYKHSFVPNSSPLGSQYVCNGSLAINGVPVDKSASYRYDEFLSRHRRRQLHRV
jgi:hypothetical protein